MERKTFSVQIDYNSKKVSTVLKSDPCEFPDDHKGQLEKSILIGFLQDPNNQTCEGQPFQMLSMYHADQHWVIRMDAVVRI